MMQDNFNNQSHPKEEDFIDIKKEAGYYLFFWPYFLAGVIIALVSAFLYIKTADRIYTSSAQLQIKKPAEDAASFLTGGMEFFGFDQVNVENDIAVLTSQHILSQVVERLDLQTKIYTVGRVNASLQFDNDYTRFVSIKAPNANLYWDIEISKEKAFFTQDTLSFAINKGEVFKYQESEITLHDSLYLKNQTLIIERQPLNDAVAVLRDNLSATAATKQGEIIDLNFIGVNISRNEAILNTVMQVMKDDQVKDKRLVSKVSLAFINDRLDGLTKSIDTLSQNTIDFQMANGIFDPVAQTGNALSNIVKGQEEAFDIGIQLEIAKALLEKLENQASYQILPANIGIENASVNTLVDSYNTAVTQRNNLLISATTKSPMVMQFSSQLDNAKAAIIIGVNRYIEGLQTSLSGFKNMEAKTKGIVAGLPSKENALRAYARDFKIVEELYVFLLERKEEASIAYISALPNIKMLSYGVSSRFPIAPKKSIIYLVALLIGLLLPFGFVFLRKFLDNKVYSKNDISDAISVPFLGSIPCSDDLKTLVVTSDDRTATSEAFRLIRANLNFMLPNIDKGSKTIFVTSSTSGEGKSFISINIAAALALSGKKVLLMGMDFRAPKINKYLSVPEKKGITNYISDSKLSFEELKYKIPNIKSLDIIPSGLIPPNPSELLTTDRLAVLFLEVKQQYDFIVVDTAPVNLVSDTLLIAKYADMFMYVVRANYSDKRSLVVPDELYKENKLPNIAIVLNDVDSRRDGYGGYGYGGYGYGGYGYGGYGYGATEVKKPWYRRIFS